MPTIRSIAVEIPLLMGLAIMATSCRSAVRVTPSDAATVLATRTLEAPDPGARGPFEIRTLYYGSGTDKNRVEYRDSVTLNTEPVDASKLVSLGGSARDRNDYWGFTPKEFPLNARVWYPEGDGPFPLVLVVHGNHNMRDFSDPGYDYLGELLASRGFILASVDMNFINGGIRGENDGRGWLLLKHLQAWRDFNEDGDSPFRGKVDMEHIGLMGHSRGGEAVAIAAAFNRLSRYPDDASLEFDFGFDLKAIVSIAPVDGQYLPTGRKAPIRDVNYLVFHGSHDGDVTSFHGLRLWDRVEFTDGGDYFKSAVYMYRANHGQWNTVWNSNDNGTRSARILDLRALVPPQDQRRFAEIYVSAFLEATLRDDDRWLPIFRDHRVIGDWLPPTMYVTRFQDASFRVLADFEEDIDVTTGSTRGVSLRGDSLATWKEETLLLRSANRTSTSSSQENQGLVLAWNHRLAGEDTTRLGPEATYHVDLPPGLAQTWALDAETSVQLSLAAAERVPGPRRAPEPDSTEEGEQSERAAARGGGSREDTKPPVDLSIEVEDGAGRSARVPLSRYGAIRRPLEIRILRRSDLEEDRFATLSELVLQTYVVPLGDFIERSPGLDLEDVRAVRLVFDLATAGEVVVDEIGFSRLPPAFWSSRAP